MEEALQAQSPYPAEGGTQSHPLVTDAAFTNAFVGEGGRNVAQWVSWGPATHVGSSVPTFPAWLSPAKCPEQSLSVTFQGRDAIPSHPGRDTPHCFTHAKLPALGDTQASLSYHTTCVGAVL